MQWFTGRKKHQVPYLLRPCNNSPLSLPYHDKEHKILVPDFLYQSRKCQYGNPQNIATGLQLQPLKSPWS